MKKLLVVVVAALAGFAIWRKVESGKAEEELWAEITDTV
ncbi:MAG: DLW-39 family protein [Kineosporiaceae bacterium]